MPFLAKTGSLSQGVRDLIEGRTRDLVLEPEHIPGVKPMSQLEVMAWVWKHLDGEAVKVLDGDKVLFAGRRGDGPEKWYKPERQEQLV